MHEHCSRFGVKRKRYCSKTTFCVTLHPFVDNDDENRLQRDPRSASQHLAADGLTCLLSCFQRFHLHHLSQRDHIKALPSSPAPPPLAPPPPATTFILRSAFIHSQRPRRASINDSADVFPPEQLQSSGLKWRRHVTRLTSSEGKLLT